MKKYPPPPKKKKTNKKNKKKQNKKCLVPQRWKGGRNRGTCILPTYDRGYHSWGTPHVGSQYWNLIYLSETHACMVPKLYCLCIFLIFNLPFPTVWLIIPLKMTTNRLNSPILTWPLAVHLVTGTPHWNRVPDSWTRTPLPDVTDSAARNPSSFR